MFVNGVDTNYAPLMEEAGLKWKDQDGRELDDLHSFLNQKGVNSLRLRIWVGDSGPSRLSYAMKLAERAVSAGFTVQPTIFLSDSWADLYKQPEPRVWGSPEPQKKLELVRCYVSEVASRLATISDSIEYYQVGNEIDYGVCGIFARDKKRRRDIGWLRRRVWTHEAEILKEAIRAIGTYDNEKHVALHLGKWWEPSLLESFLSTMDDLNVEYDVVCISFYPSMFGSGFQPLTWFRETVKDRGKIPALAEYAYPSGPVKGRLWFMGKPSEGYPLTQAGQELWVRDFLSQCLKLGIHAAYYWSPELYLAGKDAMGLKGPEEMPLNFGWAPMSLFDDSGYAKPSINSLRYGVH